MTLGFFIYCQQFYILFTSLVQQMEICIGDTAYYFWFYPYIHRCVLALYTQYFPEQFEKEITGILFGWFKRNTSVV